MYRSNGNSSGEHDVGVEEINAISLTWDPDTYGEEINAISLTWDPDTYGLRISS